MGAVSFIETMDHTSLSHITQAEFEKYAHHVYTFSIYLIGFIGMLKMLFRPYLILSLNRLILLSQRQKYVA